MSRFTPGQFRKSLQDKIKLADSTQPQDNAPYAIKNNSQESFTQQASTYAAKEMKDIRSSVQAPQSTASLPKDSFINKSVHERMQIQSKAQFGGK